MRSFASLSLAVLVLVFLTSASNFQTAAIAQPAPTQMVAQTPPMGWNSWNFFFEKVTDKDIRDSADQIVATGTAAGSSTLTFRSGASDGTVQSASFSGITVSGSFLTVYCQGQSP